MTIYVVEHMYDYTVQIGWSTSKEVAEQKCKEFEKDHNTRAWVRPYTLDKNKWSNFDCD